MDKGPSQSYGEHEKLTQLTSADSMSSISDVVVVVSKVDQVLNQLSCLANVRARNGRWLGALSEFPGPALGSAGERGTSISQVWPRRLLFDGRLGYGEIWNLRVTLNPDNGT